MSRTIGNEPINIEYDSNGYVISYGLTKREYFATIALNSIDYKTYGLDTIATRAVQIADALIAELNKDKNEQK